MFGLQKENPFKNEQIKKNKTNVFLYYQQQYKHLSSLAQVQTFNHSHMPGYHYCKLCLLGYYVHSWGLPGQAR